MTTKIYWFSGTGNSLAVARMLAEKLSNTERIPMARAFHDPPEPADRVGLVFPVYAFGPPAIVLRFIRRLKLRKDSMVFVVCTCAITPGNTVGFVQKALHKRGADLSGAWTVKQPENYPPLGGTPGPKSQAKTQAKADEKTARIASALLDGVLEIEPSGFFRRLIGRLVYPAFRVFESHAADRFFRADKKCNGCGTCASVCPVENIELRGDRPVWLGQCEQCFACFHWCPQNAVQYGGSSWIRRYHHPRTVLSDFLDR